MGKRRQSHKFPKVTCSCGCKQRFVKDRHNRIYATKQCKDRVGQRNLRKRARLYPERVVEQFGSIGAMGRQPHGA